MKLDDSLEKYETVVNVKRFTRPFNKRKYQHKMVPGKSGKCGRIHYDVNNTRVVHKINHIPVNSETDIDAYSAYITAIVQGNVGQRNPFALRVYSAKGLFDSNYDLVYKYKIERLTAFDDLESGMYACVIDDLFFEDDIENVRIKYNSSERTTNDGNLLMILLVDAFHNRVNTKNANLKEIITIVDGLIRAGGFSRDLHRSNFMFRLENNIPQLVVVDPIADLDVADGPN